MKPACNEKFWIGPLGERERECRARGEGAHLFGYDCNASLWVFLPFFLFFFFFSKSPPTFYDSQGIKERFKRV